MKMMMRSFPCMGEIDYSVAVRGIRVLAQALHLLLNVLRIILANAKYRLVQMDIIQLQAL
jgi:hypothetical protein